ncbi:MAG: hypothetical protein ACFE8B_11700 [Candidatus Hermodarchaeota archaeon]
MRLINKRICFYIGVVFFVVLPILALASYPPGEDPPIGCAGDYDLDSGVYVSGGIADTYIDDGYTLHIVTESVREYGDYWSTYLKIVFVDVAAYSMDTVKIDISGWQDYIGTLKFRYKHSHGWHSAWDIENGMNDLDISDGVIKKAKIYFERLYYEAPWGPQDSALHIDLLRFFQ